MRDLFLFGAAMFFFGFALASAWWWRLAPGEVSRETLEQYADNLRLRDG